MGRGDRAGGHQVRVNVVMPGHSAKRRSSESMYRRLSDFGVSDLPRSRQSGMTEAHFPRRRTRPILCRWRKARNQRDPAKHSKKDPAKPTRAKASRPDMPVLDDSLADLLNPGHRPGHGRTWRADRAAATARQFLGPPRRLRQCASGARLGGARFWRGAAAGLCRQKSGRAGRARSRSGESAWASTKRPMPPSAAASSNMARKIAASARGRCPKAASARSAARRASNRSTVCCARAATNSALSHYGRRTGRRGRTSPKAAASSSSNPTSTPRAISRRRSRIWSKACGATTAPRCCSASPAPARLSPWPR